MAEQAVWTKELIAENIESHDKWLYRGIMAIYNKQTADEQAVETTKYNNGVGFNGRDAKFMSSLAKSYQKYNRLTGRQIAAARKVLKKYCGQLTKIANGEC